MPYRRGGNQYKKHYGSRAEVFHGSAFETTGRLRRHQLMRNKRGAIVSKKASARAKQANRLEKAGYKTKKGSFYVFQSIS